MPRTQKTIQTPTSCRETLETSYCTELLNVFETFLPQLLMYPNPADPLNGEAAALLMNTPEEYKARVRGESGPDGPSVVATNGRLCTALCNGGSHRACGVGACACCRRGFGPQVLVTSYFFRATLSRSHTLLSLCLSLSLSISLKYQFSGVHGLGR